MWVARWWSAGALHPSPRSTCHHARGMAEGCDPCTPHHVTCRVDATARRTSAPDGATAHRWRGPSLVWETEMHSDRDLCLWLQSRGRNTTSVLKDAPRPCLQQPSCAHCGDAEPENPLGSHRGSNRAPQKDVAVLTAGTCEKWPCRKLGL